MIENICKKAIEIGEREGAHQVETFVINGRILNLYVEGSKVNIITENKWIGIGIKLAIGKRVGFVSGIYANEKSLHEIIKEGIKITRVSPEDPKFESLPEPKQISGVIEDVYDEHAANVSSSELYSFAKEVIENTKKNGVKVMRGLIRINIFEFSVMNSLGVDFSHEGTNIFVHFTAKREFGEGIVKKYATMLNELNWEKIGEELHEKTLIASQAKAFKGSEKLEVIIEPMELAGMLSDLLMAANGENINRKRSPWIGKIGEQVTAECLTIVDDGRLRGGLRSALADDEGVPTTRKAIIEKGVLKSYYFDYYNARIAKVTPTGNGYRRGVRTIEDAHNRMALSSLSNVEVIAGNKSYDELISEIDKGVIIKKFAYPTVDFLTGNFALEVRSAVLVENGEETQPIKHALLVGNMYDCLKNITGIAKEREKIGIVLLPAIRFREMQLVGL